MSMTRTNVAMVVLCAIACAGLVGCGGSGGSEGDALGQGTVETVPCQEVLPGGTTTLTPGSWFAQQAYPGMSADEIMERVSAFDTPEAALTTGGSDQFTINGTAVTEQQVGIEAADGFAFAECGQNGGQMSFVLH